MAEPRASDGMALGCGHGRGDRWTEISAGGENWGGRSSTLRLLRYYVN
jgi:hypothetical protein